MKQGLLLKMLTEELRLRSCKMTEQKILNVLNPALKSVAVRKYLDLLKDYHKETYEHSRRVGLLCVYLGIKNSLPKEKIKLLGYAGLLHDVGKLDVPLSILSKKSELTEKEIKKIREHPRRGFFMLKESELDDIRKIIIMHHEYCNTPYPRSGKDRRATRKKERRTDNGFEELAQILSVADMYDALSHMRSYHEPLDCEDIEKIMKKQFMGKKRYIKQIIKKCLVDSPV
jgi:HD-GYP domain-containing protein (c-di-GMP phosphodiesterase class II)